MTSWYATDEPPTTDPVVVVDGRRRGPVVNAAVMTAAAPTWAPPGQHLVQVTCLLGERAPDEPDARRQAGEMFGVSDGVLAGDRAARHPGCAAGAAAAARGPAGVDLGDGRFVCGDHRDTASVQGAMVSGRRAATAVGRRLGVRTAPRAPRAPRVAGVDQGDAVDAG